METGHIGRLIRYERIRKGISGESVCSGICDLNIYDKIENENYSVDIHIVRFVLQRLGMGADMAGRYLCRDEYDEMSARFGILEFLKANQLVKAEKAVCEYHKRYCKENKLNDQFREYMSARIAELEGDIKGALRLYKSAVSYTVMDYAGDSFICLSKYEYFMLANIARLTARLGRIQEAEGLYEKLLSFCKNKKLEKWILTCIYPKTVCEMLDVYKPQDMGNYERSVWLEECETAIRVLRDTSRLHFLGSLLKNIEILRKLLGDEADRNWSEFYKHYEWLRNKYDVTGDLLEWYPYYNGDWEFYSVEKLINERRKLYGMTIEKLADGVCTPETVSRIINRRVSPRYSTVEALLDKLGLKGVMSEHVIVSEDYEAYRIWDEMVGCQSIEDDVTGRRLYKKLKGKLDMNIPINRQVLDYKRIELDMSVDENNYEEYADIHEKMLGFHIEDIKKLTILTRIEGMIINRFFYCMDRIKDYSKLGIFEIMCGRCTGEVCRAFACDCEGVIVRCASYTGNITKFEISNNYSKKGIELELVCERTHVLSSLIYCISWNHVESGITASDDDIKLCECAYWIAWMLRDNRRMDLYSHWLGKHNTTSQT